MTTLIGTKWAIKHKPTGHYLPVPRGRMGRGGSFTEPCKPEPGVLNTQARLFDTKRSADNCLSQWLRGEHHGVFEYEEGYTYTVGADVKPVASRVREDMEVVEVKIVEG